eukprot:1042245-Prorocentrum_lima.AAC.1
MGGVQRRTNTSSMHSTRTGTKCEGKQSCDQGQMVELGWDQTAWCDSNRGIQTIFSLLQQQSLAQLVVV